ncbi:MAG: permease prefix domain 1-containing protein [Oscillospiraceae bacterium]|nr:permease prefix domain 1-containing protein [Oscillospiraceae bacterium]
MQKYMTDYLDKTCAVIRGRELRQTARGELADHMRERYGDLIADGLEPEAAALETIKRMGDPETLGRRITEANRSHKGLINALIGLVLFIFGIFLIGAISGAEIIWYFDAASFTTVIILTVAYAFLCCGSKLTLLKFMRHIKSGALYAGGIVALATLILVFQSMADNPSAVGAALATTLIAPIYGLLLSAAARIAESRLPSPEDGAIKNLLE